ncbi:uncharacterized protein LOC143179602 [Calliopsis andreniformis]|uniref:uncharacterized protein LOC143179602 n=1 Tax=Calliopsis andreniformis TaxID=337506 RepID=UPI003FCCBA32
MATFRRQYKEKPFGFGDIKEGRNARGEACKQTRKTQRATVFNENRDILSSLDTKTKEIQSTSNVGKDRMTRLLKWKAERDKRKEVECRKKKPVFVVGVVHHNVYSPLNKDELVHKHNKDISKIHNIPKAFPKGITKATQKRLINKATTKATTQSTTQVKAKTSNSGIRKELKQQKIQKQSIVPNDYKFKAPTGLPEMLFGRVPHGITPSKMINFMSFSPMVKRSNRKSNTAQNINNEKCNVSINDEKEDINDSKESSTEDIVLRLSSDDDEKLHSSNNNSNSNNESSHKYNSKIKELNNMSNNNSTIKASPSPNSNKNSMEHSDSLSSEPAFFSPYVVSSRGKSNARKEQQLRHGFSLGYSPVNDIPTKDTVMKNLNISVEEEVRTAQYFQFLLNRETDKLNELCRKWEMIKDEAGIAEDAQYQINQAIGQTNLLISKKFERFRGLVSDCETGKGEMLVTCKDLQGFWDMMYIEVQNCNSRFEKLEKLHAQGWQEEEEEKPPSKGINKKKTSVKNKVVPKKSNSLRTFLIEKKKNMPQKLRSGNDMAEIHMLGNINSSSTPYKAQKSVANSLYGRKFTPIKHEKRRSSLLRKVQLSERKIKSPLTVIKISQMCKTPEIQLDSSISYVNSDQIPRKRILKQPKSPGVIDSQRKSSHKVNFDDNVNLNDIPVDEETQLKYDLAAALERIDSLNLDQPSEDVTFNVQKKLNFGDNSCEESEDVHSTHQDSELKNSTRKNITKLPRISRKHATPRPSLRRQNAIEDNDKNSHENSNDDRSENNESIRVLRNRSITSVTTPELRRKSLRKTYLSMQELEAKENKTPSSVRRKGSVKADIKDDKQINSSMELESAININLNENNSKRRQSTRTVKFSGSTM